MGKFDDKTIHTFYICKCSREFGLGEGSESEYGGEDNRKVFSVWDLHAIMICTRDTLYHYLRLSGNENSDEIGFDWAAIDYYKNNGFTIKIFNKDGTIIEE